MMKKALLAVVAVIVLVPAVGFGYLSTLKPAQRPAPTETIVSTPERVARGKYLVEVVVGCIDCHSQFNLGAFTFPPKAGTEYTGGFCFDKANAGFPGKVCGQNITQDKETGIGGWTDGEIMRAVREGVNRHGEALFPMMPYPFLKTMSDEDMASVVAYLRTIPPVKNETPEGFVDFPVNLFIKFEPKPLEGPVPHPDTTSSVAYGKYLADLACMECHTPVNDKMQSQFDRAYEGGRTFDLSQVAPGLVVRSANLTPDDETGIGLKSRENWIAQFAAFRDPEFQAMKVSGEHNTLMPWVRIAKMSDEDLGAIYDYLRTLKPVKNAVERRELPEKTSAEAPAPAATEPSK